MKRSISQICNRSLKSIVLSAFNECHEKLHANIILVEIINNISYLFGRNDFNFKISHFIIILSKDKLQISRLIS